MQINEISLYYKGGWYNFLHWKDFDRPYLGTSVLISKKKMEAELSGLKAYLPRWFIIEHPINIPKKRWLDDCQFQQPAIASHAREHN